MACSHWSWRHVAFVAVLALAVTAAHAANDDMPDPAKRFRLTPPASWDRVELSCEEWRYDSPDGRGSMFLAVRWDVGVREPARAAARTLAEALFTGPPTEIPNGDTTYHGAPVARLIGTFHSGANGFTNSTAITLKDGSSLLWVEVGLLPPGISREAQIAFAEVRDYSWRSLRTTEKVKRTDCSSSARASLPLPKELEQWVGTPAPVAVEQRAAVQREPEPTAAPATGGVPLSDLIAAGLISEAPGEPELDVGGSGLAYHPFLTVHEVRVKPTVAAPGADIMLEIDLTVSHSGAGSGNLPVMLVHSILYGGRVVYEGPTETYRVANNRRTTITKSLRAASRPGAFVIKVSLVYDSAQDSGSAAFEIR